MSGSREGLMQCVHYNQPYILCLPLSESVKIPAVNRWSLLKQFQDTKWVAQKASSLCLLHLNVLPHIELIPHI